MKPIIGITMSKDSTKGHHTINSYYIDSVFAAGGIPFIVPMITEEEDFESYLNILDGIVFSGGLDISPLRYNENPLKEVNYISSLRDNSEFELFKRAYEMKMPILGICRGLQLMNVALSGSLYQDINIQIPGSLGHNPSMSPKNEAYHSIDIKEDTRFYNMFKRKTIYVNSEHHQSIKDLGDNLIVSAVSEDGVIEAAEAVDDRFLLGVQFHPEYFVRSQPEFLVIYKELVKEAGKFKM